MRLTSRRDPAADVIRARLRVLLDEGRRSGWLPDDDPLESPPGTGVALLRRPEPPGGRGEDDLGTHLDDERDDPDDQADGRLPGGLGRHRAPGRAVRLDPGRRGGAALWLTGLLVALLLAGWTWLQRPEVEPAPEPVPAGGEPVAAGVEPAPAATTESAPAEAAGARTTVVVSVVGLVVTPGLVTLPEGARVADAVAAAGGLLPEADPASVNLAAVVSDGQQIAVGVPGAAPAPAAGGAAPAGPLDLNAATVADLDALPGIGPVLAQRIVDHREQHGRFTSVEQLDDVPGIGPAVYGDLADLVRV
ncbi:ComEA family DNA-binding protein [Geodermatophilus sp. SYSU D01045]